MELIHGRGQRRARRCPHPGLSPADQARCGLCRRCAGPSARGR